MKSRTNINKFITLIVTFALILGMFCGIGVDAATNRTQNNAADWAKGKVGTQAIDTDGYYAAQCVDLIQGYYAYLGVSGGGGNARDYATNTLPAGFNRIADYIGFIPQPGDIAVWTLGYGGGWYGHVGVVISADGYNLTVADQYGGDAIAGVHYDSNSGKTITTSGQVVHQTTYSYNGNGMSFWGVIRPDFASSSAPITTVSVDEGNYFLKSGNNYLTASQDWNIGNVTATAFNNEKNQQFYIYKNASGYNLQSLSSNAARVLNVDSGTVSAAGNNVTLYDRTNHPTQIWVFEKKGDAYVVHPSDNTAIALTVQDNNNVNLSANTGASNQLWYLEKVAEKNKLGDVNGDLNVNIKDATDVQKHCASIIKFTSAQLQAADVNFDTRVNVADATAIQKLIAGL